MQQPNALERITTATNEAPANCACKSSYTTFQNAIDIQQQIYYIVYACNPPLPLPAPLTPTVLQTCDLWKQINPIKIY